MPVFPPSCQALPFRQRLGTQLAFKSHLSARTLSTLPGNTPTSAPKFHRPRRSFNLYVKSTRNNTIMSLVGKVVNGQLGTFCNVSGGLVGFKKVQRSGYEAGYQCAVRMFAAIKAEAEKGPIAVTLLFNGFGQGREATNRALMSPDGEAVRSHIVRVTDRTPIPMGGVRPKKKRTL
jgi:small subunit ribosomal protein S11